METRPISFGMNLPRKTLNRKPLTRNIPKNYYLDTSVSKFTLGINKVYKFLKEMPIKIAKYLSE